MTDTFMRKVISVKEFGVKTAVHKGGLREYRLACGHISFDTDAGTLALWLRADLGVTKDGSNKVSVWADQSGNNRASNHGIVKQKHCRACEAKFRMEQIRRGTRKAVCV